MLVFMTANHWGNISLDKKELNSIALEWKDIKYVFHLWAYFKENVFKIYLEQKVYLVKVDFIGLYGRN